MMHRLIFLFALIGLGWGGPAMAQTYSVDSITQGTYDHIAAAATGQSIFRANAVSGAVTKLSGNGVRISTGTVRSQVSVRCSGNNNCGDAGKEVLVTINLTGTPTGRAAALQNFTIAPGTAVIAVAPGTGNSITFRLAAIPRNATHTFWVGYDLPINGDNTAGATGNAASQFVVAASRPSGSNGNSLSGTASAIVRRSLTITKTADLNFGSLSPPTTGTGTVSLAHATGALTLTGTGVAKHSVAPTTAAAFTIAGEGGQAVTVSVPTSFVMTGPGGSITVTTIPSHSGAQTLSGALGAAGTIPLKVGGSFGMTTTTGQGTYTGVLSVTVQYN